MSVSPRIAEGAHWLIKLRWVAGCGIIAIALLAYFVMKVQFELAIVLILSAILLLYNFLAYMFCKQKNLMRKISLSVHNFVFIQFLIDLLLLTFILHYTGGVENPFVIYYVFHMIISAILLTERRSYITTTIGILLIGMLEFLEFHGIIAHYPLKGFIDIGFYNNPAYVTITGLVFVSTSYTVVYITSYVTNRLRRQEQILLEANDELHEKDNIKNEYVIRVSHDIKGHLAAIKNSLDVTLMQHKDTENMDFAKRAHIRTISLTKFVTDLLHLTQMRLRKQLVIETISIEKVIEKVVEDYKDQITNKQQNLILNLEKDLPDINANRLSIIEAVSNLVSNAVKYTPDGGNVFIKSKMIRDFIEIKVIDTGIGIPADDVKHIFQEFYRAGNAKSSNIEGTGVGMALVKQIIEHHKGRVSFESEENKGTVVKILLPIT